MKHLVYAFALVSALSAQSQNQPATPPSGTTIPTPAPPAAQQLPPGLQNREQLPPGLQNREQLPPGLQRTPGAQGQFRGQYVQTNLQSGVTATNLTRGSMGTNMMGWGSNQVPRLGTNFQGGFSTTNNQAGTNGVALDRAATPADQRLLVQIRQQIRPLTEVGRSWSSVHFLLNRGVVTVAGFIPDVMQRQQLLTVLRSTPGVVQIVDRLEIRTESTVIGQQNGAGQAPSAQSANIQDQATTSFDRNLVVQIRQRLVPLIGAGEPWTPVQFVAREGIVTVAGFVPNEQQRTQLIATVRQTPGVVRVIDQLSINITAVGSTNSGVMGMGTNINLTHTGRTNIQDRVYPQDGQPQPQPQNNLPPGLRDREQGQPAPQ